MQAPMNEFKNDVIWGEKKIFSYIWNGKTPKGQKRKPTFPDEVASKMIVWFLQ